ncbi:MAG: hypothetical protein Q8M94_12165 [Ignavibacteria bacterium]|nr:hypothetical protein [Ignavibacteria bacterium]
MVSLAGGAAADNYHHSPALPAWQTFGGFDDSFPIGINNPFGYFYPKW